MKLWTQWLQAVCCLRPACQRSLTFVWMTLVLMGLCYRSDNLGVTSFVRVLNLRRDAYHRLLHLFHSTALDLDVLTSCWVRLCLVLLRPFEVGSRLECLADGIKAPTEGKRMPGVKLLHQQSASTYGSARGAEGNFSSYATAPAGKTPVVALTVGGTRQKLSLIATVTNQSKTRWILIKESFDADKFCEFLQALIKDAGKKMLPNF